jgi:hypothetical protein
MGHRWVRIVALFTILIAAPAWAMQLAMSRPELCAMSDRVVIGEVTSGETLWAEGEDGGIFRRVWIASERDLRGGGSDTVEVVLPGGTIGEFQHSVEDVPNLAIDGRYLLFLRRSDDGSYSILGGHQGAVQVQPPTGGAGERFIDALSSVGRCNEA